MANGKSIFAKISGKTGLKFSSILRANLISTWSYSKMSMLVPSSTIILVVKLNKK